MRLLKPNIHQMKQAAVDALNFDSTVNLTKHQTTLTLSENSYEVLKSLLEEIVRAHPTNGNGMAIRTPPPSPPEGMFKHMQANRMAALKELVAKFGINKPISRSSKTLIDIMHKYYIPIIGNYLTMLERKGIIKAETTKKVTLGVQIETFKILYTPA